MLKSEQLLMKFAIEEKKRHALLLIGDNLSNYFYYDRKGDEKLSVIEMKELINSGTLTADDLITEFSNKIREIIKNSYNVRESKK